MLRVFIPFRDRGTDPRRMDNLIAVLKWWGGHGVDPVIISDGLGGDAPFNRHRAYNRAVTVNETVPEGPADVLVFTEADMILPISQILNAGQAAFEDIGLVVPFKEYRYLSPSTTEVVRDRFNDETPDNLAEWWTLPVEDHRSLFQILPESTMVDGDSIGAVNVVSRKTLDLTGGFTEATSGNWYDDNIIEEGFAYLSAPTRWIEGPAVHLYHLPGWKGEHLSAEDKAATQNNKNLLIRMRTDIKTKQTDAVKALMSYRQEG